MAHNEGEDAKGYRVEAVGGPRVRTDVVDVYVFQRAEKPPRPVVGAGAGGGSWGGVTPDTGAEVARDVYFLQLLRAGDPLGGTWQPVMGHVERGERAAACARRELREELGLAEGDGALLGLWALEQVHGYFVAELDAIVLSARFAAEVAEGWTPRMNEEHSAHRWVQARDVMRGSGEGAFMWPGQKLAAREVVESLIVEGSVSEGRLRM